MIEQYRLSNEDIDKASERIVEFLTEQNKQKKDIQRIRLGIEETLLRFREQFGENTDFELKAAKRFGKIVVSVSVEGRMYDPFAKNGNAEQDSALMRSVLTNMGELPTWRYSRGENIVTYTLSKKPVDSWVHLIIAIVLAVLVAFILKALPQSVMEVIRDEVLTPLLDTFMNLLSAIAGPMIFLAVVWGIYSIGDVSAFSVMCKKLIGRLVLYCTFLTIGLGLLFMPLFSFSGGQLQSSSGFSDLFRMVLDIVPGNIIIPFAEGNTLQILFIAITMGIAMIIIGERTQNVALFAEQLNYIVQLIMEFISKLVPIFVFGSLLNIILNNQLDDIKVSYKLFLINVAGCVAMITIYLLLICIRYHVNPVIYIKKALKPFIICLTTASSSAAFSTSLDTCINGYGIDENFTNFGVPFAQVLYKPMASILYFTSAMCVAELSGTAVSAGWFVTAMLASIVLSIATPPIPGGTLASISVLFAQLALPAEGMAIVLALNIILDFIDTPVNNMGGHALLILTADKFGLLNKNTLRRAGDK